MLSTIYGDAYSKSSAIQNVSAIAFAGTVVGQLIFGCKWSSNFPIRDWGALVLETCLENQCANSLNEATTDCFVISDTSDKWSRKNSLLVSTIILIIFAALGAGAYGAGGSAQGLFAAITAYRFLVGIGIGGEYPAGSVACSEATGELKSGTRNRWFIMFTNVMIDWGFVIGAFIPYLLVVICTSNHLRAAWRISLGLGVVPPLLLLYLRIRLQEPEEFKKESMKYVRTPYLLVLRYYWLRL